MTLSNEEIIALRGAVHEEVRPMVDELLLRIVRVGVQVRELYPRLLAAQNTKPPEPLTMTTITVQIDADATHCQTRSWPCRFLDEIKQYGPGGVPEDSRWACHAYDLDGTTMELATDAQGIPLRCDECRESEVQP